MHVGLASSKPIPVQLDRFVTDGLIESMAKRFPVVSARKQVQTLSIAENAALWGLQPEQLLPIGPFRSQEHIVPLMTDALTGEAKFQLVAYTPHVNGVPVYASAMRLLVRNEPGFPLVLASVQIPDVSGFAIPGGIQPGLLNENLYTSDARDWFEPNPEISGIRPVVFAGINGVTQEPQVAVEFILTGNDAGDGGYAKWKFLADPATGTIYHSENQILHADVDVQVVGNVTDGPGGDECHPETIRGVPHARVTVGGSVYTADENGMITIPNGGSGSVTVTGECRTNWFNVQNQAGSDHTASVTIPSGGSGQLVLNDANLDEFIRSETNIIYFSEEVRNFTLDYNALYPTIASQTNFTCNANTNSSCNAFYDGNSINFYRAGGGCGNTGAGAIVHHEYGHHLVAVAGSGQGEYGEGAGDVMGVLITGENRLGLGFYQGNCLSGIRDADNNCTYSSSGCSSCGSQIHSCGQLLSGMIWDIRENLINAGKSVEIVNDIFVNSILLHNGSSINSAITIDWLTLNDDNGNINDGTPDYAEINAGCSVHGLPGPELDFLTFSFPGGLPSAINPSTGAEFNVSVSGVSATPIAGSGTLTYRVDGSAWTTIDMNGSSNDYVASLPGAECGLSVDYYVSADASNGQSYNSGTYSALSATEFVIAFEDDFDTNQGWSIENDSTTTDGFWTRGQTEGSGRGQAGSAFSGLNCYNTDNGNDNGTNSDVDGGCTSLVSPIMDASAPGSVISYTRWYDNTGSGTGAEPNADYFTIDVSDNGGSTWTNLETIGPVAESEGGWFSVSYVISEYVSNTDQFQIRFIACDQAGGSVIEAAVDLISIEAVVCDKVEPPANDECSGAYAVTEGSNSLTTVDSTDSTPILPLACNSGNGPDILNDVWYTYTPKCTGEATVSLCGQTDFDDRIAIYVGSCPDGNSSTLACSDDECGSSSLVSFVALENQPYTIRIGSPDGSTGSGTMTISCEGSGTPCPADINGDNVVDGADLGLLLTAWGTSNSDADINGDLIIDGADLGLMLTAWGECL